MLSAAWKAGDVAMVTVRDGGEHLAFRTMYGWLNAACHSADDLQPVAEVRPLVVVDPENREQIDQLVDAAFEIAAKGSTYADALQSVLRTKAAGTPPKPAEPTGLGAVVVDASGECWVLAPADGETALEWLSSCSTTRNWDALDAVKVLSEGVTP